MLGKRKRVQLVRVLAVGGSHNLLTELQLAAADGQQYVVVNGNWPDAGDRVKRQNITGDFRVICRRGGPCQYEERSGGA